VLVLGDLNWCIVANRPHLTVHVWRLYYAQITTLSSINPRTSATIWVSWAYGPTPRSQSELSSAVFPYYQSPFNISAPNFNGSCCRKRRSIPSQDLYHYSGVPPQRPDHHPRTRLLSRIILREWEPATCGRILAPPNRAPQTKISHLTTTKRRHRFYQSPWSRVGSVGHKRRETQRYETTLKQAMETYFRDGTP